MINVGRSYLITWIEIGNCNIPTTLIFVQHHILQIYGILPLQHENVMKELRHLYGSQC